MKARCIRATKHFKIGDIIEVPSEKHPFVTSGDFEILQPPIQKTPNVKYTFNPSIKKPKRRK